MKTRADLAKALEEIKKNEWDQYDHLRRYFDRNHAPGWSANMYNRCNRPGRRQDDSVLGLEIKTDTGTAIRVIWEDEYTIVKRADGTAEHHVNPVLMHALTDAVLDCANDSEPCDCDEHLCGKHEGQRCGCTTRTCEHDKGRA